MINHFHNKGFALRLILKARLFGTWKWLIRNWPISMTFKPWHSFEGLGLLFSNRQFKGPTSKPTEVEGETSNFLANFYGRRKKSTGGFNPANWRKPHRRVLICLVPRPHYSPRPIRFRLRGPCEDLDMSPKWIDREGLEEHHAGTRQATRQAILYSWLPILKNFQGRLVFCWLDISKARTLI